MSQLVCHLNMLRVVAVLLGRFDLSLVNCKKRSLAEPLVATRDTAETHTMIVEAK